MFKYILKRILMMIPTLFGITLVTFFIINLAPGGPVEQKIQQLKFAGAAGGGGGVGSDLGISDEVLEALKKQYGFDKPVHVRYWIWLKNLARLDFGESFSYEEPVIDVIVERFPVSLQFGLISLLLTYLISIPLGVAKGVRDGSVFDSVTSFVLFIMYSVPPIMLGLLLLVFLAGGSFLEWFPLGDIYSDAYDDLGFWGKVGDRIHHFILPMCCYMIGSFTLLSLLMKNSLIEEINLDYVRTARAKGLSEKKVVYKHAFRNSLIPIVTGLGSILAVFFAGSIIIEQLFNLNGIGLLSYQATLDRDYNVLMGLLFIQSVVMLLGRLISDVLYVIVDPRIDFN